MSIIAEALKKAQESSAKRRVPPQPVEKTKKRKSYFFSVIAVCVLLLFSGVVVFSFFRPYLIETNTEENIYDSARPEKLASKSENLPRAAETQALKKEKKITAPKPHAIIGTADIAERIQLNGIMYTPKRPLAVINDNIWAEGDTVSGFKILRIEKNSVKVASNGQEFIVRLKR